MDRAAIAFWSGSAEQGRGELTTDSEALVAIPFSRQSRLQQGDELTGTNPEELVAGALAACFTHMLAKRLSKENYDVQMIRVEARTQLVKHDHKWMIPAIKLHCTATVPGLSAEHFHELAHQAKVESAVAGALRSDITLTMSLT
jgi:osmotically inducible protein OsmC